MNHDAKSHCNQARHEYRELILASFLTALLILTLI
jgi:hypothetical protein